MYYIIVTNCSIYIIDEE